LASNRDTSNGPDWRDFAEAMAAFESQNGMRLSLQMSTVELGRDVDLCVRLMASTPNGAPAELAQSVSEERYMSSMNRRTLEAALLQLLYALDARLAWEAFGERHKAE